MHSEVLYFYKTRDLILETAKRVKIIRSFSNIIDLMAIKEKIKALAYPHKFLFPFFLERKHEVYYNLLSVELYLDSNYHISDTYKYLKPNTTYISVKTFNTLKDGKIDTITFPDYYLDLSQEQIYKEEKEYLEDMNYKFHQLFAELKVNNDR